MLKLKQYTKASYEKNNKIGKLLALKIEKTNLKFLQNKNMANEFRKVLGRILTLKYILHF